MASRQMFIRNSVGDFHIGCGVNQLTASKSSNRRCASDVRRINRHRLFPVVDIFVRSNLSVITENFLENNNVFPVQLCGRKGKLNINTSASSLRLKGLFSGNRLATFIDHRIASCLIHQRP